MAGAGEATHVARHRARTENVTGASRPGSCLLIRSACHWPCQSDRDQRKERCNPGDSTQAILDTPEAPLSARGDADFSGHIGPIPAASSNPIFLIHTAGRRARAVDRDRHRAHKRRQAGGAMTLLRHLPRLIAAVRGYPRARLGLAAHAAGGSSAFGFSEQVS